MILKCTCACGYQDRKYGPNNRVHNRKGGKVKSDSYRCTICKAERGVSGTEVAKKEK